MRKLDLAGKRFGRLLVLSDTGRRSGSSVIWRCRCDCGNIVDVPARNLLHRGTVSCGCYRAVRRLENLPGNPAENLGQVDGTNLSRIRSDRPQANNRSGYRGVSWHKTPHGGKWIAIIYFKRTRYRLGLYDTPQEAHQAYLKAKDRLHKEYLDEYEKHKGELENAKEIDHTPGQV